MLLTEREKIILSAFLNAKEALTIKELAKVTRIKERTLYREIKTLEQTLKKQNIIIKKEKSTYSLTGEIAKLDEKILDTTVKLGFSQDTKQSLIICELLKKKETSIKEIAEKFEISYNTVYSLVPKIEKVLKKYAIKISVKKGLGISIKSTQENIIILLLAILCEEISEEEFFNLLKTRTEYSANPFIKMLDIEFIQNIFEENITIMHLYSASSTKKILIALDLLKNITSKEIIEDKQSTQKEIESIDTLLDVADKYFQIKDKKYTKNLMLKILKTCAFIHENSYLIDKYSYSFIYKVNKLIKNVSFQSNIDFSSDKKLATGLIPHIKTAIERHNMKLVEKNEELEDFVLENYRELCTVIKEQLKNLFRDIEFNGVELSYIVIHFAASYEQIYRKSFVKALVVCASGIGSSKILVSQLQKNIQELENIEYTTPVKLKEKAIENYDIIISTITLEENIDYELVYTIPSKQQIERLKNKLKKRRNIKLNEKIVTTKNIQYVENIIKNTIVTTRKNNNETINEILTNILIKRFKKNVADIVIKLVNRHKKSSVVIPKTKTALFHTLHNELEKPLIIIVKLEDDFYLKNQENITEKISTIFIMLSPDDEIYKKYLGQISIAILEDEVLKIALERNDDLFIKTKLELIMIKYNKIL